MHARPRLEAGICRRRRARRLRARKVDEAVCARSSVGTLASDSPLLSTPPAHHRPKCAACAWFRRCDDRAGVGTVQRFSKQAQHARPIGRREHQIVDRGEKVVVAVFIDHRPAVG